MDVAAWSCTSIHLPYARKALTFLACAKKENPMSKKPKRTEVKVVYVRDPKEYSPPSTREPLPPHVELTPADIEKWYRKGKS